MPSQATDIIMLFGDSLTELAWGEGGYAQRLAQAYAGKLDVINRGLSGYNSEWALPVFEQVFPKKNNPGPKVRLLILWLGGNDVCLLPSPQHIPLERYISNVRKMVSMVQSPESEWYSPDTRIVLITPPVIDEAAREANLAPRGIALDRTCKVVSTYVDGIIALGKELNVPAIDIYRPLWEATENGSPAKLKEYFPDGLHWAKPAHTVLFDLLTKTIKANYPELHYDALPLNFPWWKDLNWENARESIDRYVTSSRL